jgi:hypothetical protein
VPEAAEQGRGKLTGVRTGQSLMEATMRTAVEPGEILPNCISQGLQRNRTNSHVCKSASTDSTRFREKTASILNMYRLFFLSLFPKQHSITTICTSYIALGTKSNVYANAPSFT